tara:strand:+ start:41664 stop:42707 length:1044 start_codon:yes stop_codon:yes gene_type:complete
MRISSLRSVSAICLLAASAAAQSIVFPSDHTNIGNGSSSLSWIPFSSAAPFRAQIVYEDWDLGLPMGTPISRIGFRQDGATNSASEQVIMEVSMASTSATASTMATSFAGNYVGTPTVVYPQGLFTLPALSSATPSSIVWIDLPAPHYVYGGGNLLVEFKIFLNSNGNQAFSYRLDRATYISQVTAGVPGCMHSGGQTPTLASSPTRVGSNWNLYLSAAPSNSPMALFLAPAQQLAAPYSLGALGVDPSCQGQVPLGSYVALGGNTNSGGAYSWSIPVPNMLVFNDYYMTSQAVAFDYFSPGKLVVSNADQVQFGINPAASILFGTGSTTATTGSVYANYGLVTLFN